MTVLFYIVLPLATILISIVLQKLLENPFLVAILVFAIYLILAFTAYTTDFLVNAILYTILAFITAVLTKIICCILKRMGCGCNMECEGEEETEERTINNLEEKIETLEGSVTNLTELITSIACPNRRPHI